LRIGLITDSDIGRSKSPAWVNAAVFDDLATHADFALKIPSRKPAMAAATGASSSHRLTTIQRQSRRHRIQQITASTNVPAALFAPVLKAAKRVFDFFPAPLHRQDQH